MSRPTKYANPMSQADRAREYRQRRHDRQRVALRTPTEATLNALLDELRAEVMAGDPAAAERITAELIRRSQAG